MAGRKLKMDNLTEYVILQEAEWNKIVNNLKVMIPSVEKAFLKPSKATLKTISKKIKARELRFIEQDAIRQIPGFKKEYAEAQRKVSRLDFVTNYTAKAAALTTALVSSVTKKDVDAVIKKGQMGVRNAKILPIPGVMDFVALGIFTTVILAIFATDGAAIVPAIKLAWTTIVLIAETLGQILKILIDLIGPVPEGHGIGPALKQILPGMEGDPSNLQQLLMQKDPLGYMPGPAPLS